MKKASLFCFLAYLLLPSCQTNDAKRTADGFWEFKPGYFCQLEAVAIVGDTIIIAGSYIPEEDPNLTIQPVYSYLAAFGMDGELFWEQKPEVADYVRWQFLEIQDKEIFVAGNLESPIEGHAIITSNFDSTGLAMPGIRVIDDSKLAVFDFKVFKNKQTAFLRVKEKNSLYCINQQIDFADGKFDATQEFCYEVPLTGAKYIDSNRYYLAFGSGISTQRLFIRTVVDTLTEIYFQDSLKEELINDVIFTPSSQLLLAMTAKNTAGPCILLEGTNAWQSTCLKYWPLHGTAKLLQYGDCTLMAFSAADTAKASASHLVMFDKDLKVIWEQEISRTEVFIIKDMALQHDNIIVAGTIETEGKGSSMAVKVIPLPSSKCNTLN